MVTQSRALPVPLLLTRPVAQGTDFARKLERRLDGQVQIIFTPLLAPRFLAPDLPKGPFSGLILTSQTGVEAFRRLGSAKSGLPKHVYCVGARTASAAEDLGLLPVAVAEDAASLIAAITAAPPVGALLHLQGRETRGRIVENLKSAGIDTDNAVIYAQDEQPLSAAAQSVLRRTDPVLVPLFSPRTASIFAQELFRTARVSPLFIAAISAEVAAKIDLPDAKIRVAENPDAGAMADALVLLLADILPA
jgi:uroporphyrinogen-III synthase